MKQIIILFIATYLVTGICSAQIGAAARVYETYTTEQITLGGVSQTILVRGENSLRPVLLFLHGGPGNSEMLVAHKYLPNLEKYFTVVHWDQRGAGRSFSLNIPASSLTLDRMSKDAEELAIVLKRRFNASKILLVGQSWGSILGLTTVARRPDLFCAYVGVGQVVNGLQTEMLAYEKTMHAAKTAGNIAATTELKSLGPPPYAKLDDFFRERRWLVKFGGLIYGSSDFSPIEKIKLGSRITPTSAEIDGDDQLFSVKALLSTILATDFFTTLKTIKIPIYFFLGRHDFSAPPEIAERYLDLVTAPKKTLVWFEKSAHLIHLEETDKFAETLVLGARQDCL